MRDAWVCPYCKPLGSKVFKSFYGLCNHVHSTHTKSEKCPVCSKHFKRLRNHVHQQARQVSDFKHMILYGLISSNKTGKRYQQDLKKKCKDLAAEWCRIVVSEDVCGE